MAVMAPRKGASQPLTLKGAHGAQQNKLSIYEHLWFGDASEGQARRPTLTVPARGAPLHPQVGTKERPPGTNKGTAQSQEAIDDVINTLTPPVLREDETTMEDRSSRRVRTLVTRPDEAYPLMRSHAR